MLDMRYTAEAMKATPLLPCPLACLREIATMPFFYCPLRAGIGVAYECGVCWGFDGVGFGFAGYGGDVFGA